jgi:hypothetical protein
MSQKILSRIVSDRLKVVVVIRLRVIRLRVGDADEVAFIRLGVIRIWSKSYDNRDIQCTLCCAVGLGFSSQRCVVAMVDRV